MITIIDYGLGNLGSVYNMFRKLGANVQISASLSEIEKADKLVLPGVGAFDKAMATINNNGLQDILYYCALDRKIPLLGICLGMQLLTNGSEEGQLPGLKLIDAGTYKFKSEDIGLLKVPHMGWNTVKINTPSALTTGFDAASKFYFCHSYYVKCNSSKNSILKTEYGIEFDAAVQNNNIFGVQFHPEKSHAFGMLLLRNFMVYI